MLGVHDLWLSIISGLVLNITPGPDTAYIVGRSVQLDRNTLSSRRIRCEVLSQAR